MNFLDRPLIITDVETTGLDPRVHDIIEIGAIAVDQKTLDVRGEFETKVAVQHPTSMQPEALAVNGFTEAAWWDAPELKQAMTAFAQFSVDGVFAAWNVTFDWSFIEEGFRRAGVKDLMDYHRIDLPSIVWFEYPNERLNQTQISEKFGIAPEEKPHRAINGARQSLAVLRALRAKLNS